MKARSYAKWTPDMNAALKAMWVAGVPVKNIAAVLVVSDPNVTRNSTIGQAHKLRLPRHERSRGKWRTPRPIKNEPASAMSTGPRLPTLSIQRNKSYD